MQNENVQNENIQNQAGQIKRNPTRYNDKINRGENEKSIEDDFSTSSGKNNSSQLYDDENDLGGSPVSDSSGDESTEFSGGPEAGIYDERSGNITEAQQGGPGASTTKGVQRETQQSQQQSGESLGREKNEPNQAGAGASYGAPSEGIRTDKGEDVVRQKNAQGIDEEKQMQGGANKGGQVGGAFGKDKEGNRNQSVDKGM